MVQGFPELHRIDQGLAGPIFPVQLVQVLAGDQERGDPFSVVAYADLCQITAACQQKRTSEDVRGFKTAGFQWFLTPFPVPPSAVLSF